MYRTLGNKARAKHYEMIRCYLDDDTCYDLLKYVRNNGVGTCFTANDWLEFAGEFLSKEELQKFKSKLFPLEPKEDGSDKKEKEELKAAVVEIANRIMKKDGTLIDIVDLVGTNLKKYIYLVKQCAYKYNAINRSTLAYNFEFCQSVWSFNKPIEKLTLSFPEMGDKQETIIKNIIEDRGLILNDITYRQAYFYALRQGLVSKKEKSGR